VRYEKSSHALRAKDLVHCDFTKLGSRALSDAGGEVEASKVFQAPYSSPISIKII
jgi:hypothetical protein